MKPDIIERAHRLFPLADPTGASISLSRSQLGIRGSGYRSGPYSEAIEGGTRDFIRWYSREMTAALAPLIASRIVPKENAA